MLLRHVRSSVAGIRYLSSGAAKVKAAAKPTAREGGATSSGVGDTLGRRLLSLIYPKRNAVITINKWKEEGHMVRKYELSRVVRELRKLRRFKHALEICEWMKKQEDIKLLEGDYAVHLDLIGKNYGLNSAEKFFKNLPDQMKGHLTCNALLHTYVQHRMSSKAEAQLAKMKDCGFVNIPHPYNHMITLYISNGQMEKALESIKELKKITSPDILTYNLWLTVCASQDDVDAAEKVFLELKEAKLDPDWVTYSTLTSIYTKSSLHEKAAVTLKEMEKRISKKIRAYASIISLHASLKNKDEVHRVWKKLKSTYRKPNDAEYNAMISSLLKLQELKEAENLYDEWESVSPTKDCRISNLLLAAYINNNEIEMAENFHKRMVDKDINPSYTTWELLTWAYLKQKDMEKALDCFKKAVGSVKRWEYDGKLVQELFRIFQEHKNVEGAEQLVVILRRAGQLNTEIYNALIRTYAKAEKMPLIISERMKKDKVQLDEESYKLIKLTSKMCVSDVSNYFT